MPDPTAPDPTASAPSSPRMSRRQWFRRSSAVAAGLLVAPHALAEEPAPWVPSSGRARSSGMVRLSSNENPYGPSPKAREAMIRAFDEASRYPHSFGWRALTELIAEREGVTPDHVLLGCGSGEILTMAGAAYGLHGGEVVAGDPTFQQLLRYAEHVGGYVHRVPLDDAMVHDLDAMDRRVTGSTKLVFVCNPNNPTGTLVDPGRLRAFCTSTSARAVVFVDEAYIDLLDNPEQHTMASLVRDGQPVIVARTMSKIHGLAGQRIGYALARPDIVERLQAYRMGTPNVLGLHAAIASLQDTEFQAFSRTKMAEGRRMIYALCDEVGYGYTPSHASFVLIRTGQPIEQFATAMADQGVLVGRPFPPYLDWCRVSIGTEEEMQAFASALRTVAAG